MKLAVNTGESHTVSSKSDTLELQLSEQMTRTAISTQMDDVKEGSLVRWNGRTNPQVVTTVTDSWFDVKSHSGSYYRFYPHDNYLVNRQSDAEYDVDEFEILGEVYDVSVW